MRASLIIILGVAMIPCLAQARDAVGRVGMVAPQHQVSQRYARRLVRKALGKQTTHRRWRLSSKTFIPTRPTPGMRIGASTYFLAKPKGPFLMHMSVLPSYIATVNIAKGKSSPKGLKRVRLMPLPSRAAPAHRQ